MAQFRIPEGIQHIAAFGPGENTIAVVGSNGRLVLVFAIKMRPSYNRNHNLIHFGAVIIGANSIQWWVET